MVRTMEIKNHFTFVMFKHTSFTISCRTYLHGANGDNYTNCLKSQIEGNTFSFTVCTQMQICLFTSDHKCAKTNKGRGNAWIPICHADCHLISSLCIQTFLLVHPASSAWLLLASVRTQFFNTSSKCAYFSLCVCLSPAKAVYQPWYQLLNTLNASTSGIWIWIWL